MQQKTSRPFQFEISQPTRDAVTTWIKEATLANDNFLCLSRVHESPHKASLIYRRTKKIRAVQLLLAHNKLESTVRQLGIEVEDALELSEQTEI